MRKYIVWYGDGSGRLSVAGTVEAASKAAARKTATATFGSSPREVTLPGVDPNAWGPSGNAHPSHKERMKANSQHKREKLNQVATFNGFDTWSALQNAIAKDGAMVLQNPQRCVVSNGLGRYDFILSARDAEAFSLFCEQQGLVVHFESVTPDCAD